MPSEAPQGPNTKRILTAWINHSERVISFHPVPGYLRLRTRDADGFCDEMVADKPLFKEVARNIAKVFGATGSRYR